MVPILRLILFAASLLAILSCMAYYWIRTSTYKPKQQTTRLQHPRPSLTEFNVILRPPTSNRNKFKNSLHLPAIETLRKVAKESRYGDRLPVAKFNTSETLKVRKVENASLLWESGRLCASFGTRHIPFDDNGCKWRRGDQILKCRHQARSCTSRIRSGILLAQKHSSAVFHFLIENLPKLEILRPLLPDLLSKTVIVSGPRTPSWVTDSLELYGFPKSGIVHVNETEFRCVDTLFVPESFPCGSTRPTAVSLLQHHFAHVASRLLYTTPRPSILLIRRRGERAISNMNQLVDALSRLELPLDIFDSDTQPSIMMKFFRASVIVGPHGAGISNAIFSRPGTPIVEILPPGRYLNLCYLALASAIDAPYHPVVSLFNSSTQHFRVHTSAVVAAIKTALAHTKR